MVEGIDPRRRYVMEAIADGTFLGYSVEGMSAELALAEGCPYTAAEIEDEIMALYKELM